MLRTMAPATPHAIALTDSIERISRELLRVVIVTGCGVALVAADRAFPFL